MTLSDGKVRFCWSEWQKSWIKGSFFYGYIAMQVFGGSLAEKFGTKIVLGMANTLTAILSLFIPVVSNMDWQGLLVLRIFQASHAYSLNIWTKFGTFAKEKFNRFLNLSYFRV